MLSEHLFSGEMKKPNICSPKKNEKIFKKVLTNPEIHATMYTEIKKRKRYNKMRIKREKLVLIEIKTEKTLLSENWVAENSIEEYLNFVSDFITCCRIRHKITKTKLVRAKNEEEGEGYQYCWTEGKFQIIPINYTK